MKILVLGTIINMQVVKELKSDYKVYVNQEVNADYIIDLDTNILKFNGVELNCSKWINRNDLSWNEILNMTQLGKTSAIM